MTSYTNKAPATTIAPGRKPGTTYSIDLSDRTRATAEVAATIKALAQITGTTPNALELRQVLGTSDQTLKQLCASGVREGLLVWPEIPEELHPDTKSKRGHH